MYYVHKYISMKHYRSKPISRTARAAATAHEPSLKGKYNNASAVHKKPGTYKHEKRRAKAIKRKASFGPFVYSF